MLTDVLVEALTSKSMCTVVLRDSCDDSWVLLSQASATPDGIRFTVRRMLS